MLLYAMFTWGFLIGLSVLTFCLYVAGVVLALQAHVLTGVAFVFVVPLALLQWPILTFADYNIALELTKFVQGVL
jgi:hypothetical protein